MILEDVFINLFGTMGEKDEEKKVISTLGWRRQRRYR